MKMAREPRTEPDRPEVERVEPPVATLAPATATVQRMQQTIGNRATTSLLVQRDFTIGQHRRQPGGGSSPNTPTLPPFTTPTITAPVTVTTPPVTTPPTGTTLSPPTTPPPTTAPPTTDPPAPVRSELQKKFDTALGAKKVTLKSLRSVYAKADATARSTIGNDRTLTDRARAKLDPGEFLQLMAELGVQRSDGTVAHTTAKQADDKVRAEFADYVAKQVKAGKSVVGQVVVLDGEDWLTAYYHEFPDELPRGGPTDDEPTTNAFTTTSKPKDIIVLNKDKGNPGTTVHEGMHLYQHDASMKLGSNFYEGITELLTRQITGPMGIARANYEDEHDAVALVAAAVTTDVLKAAYFKGDVAGLRKAFAAFRVGKGDSKKAAASSFTDLVEAFSDEDWAEVGRLCG